MNIGMCLHVPRLFHGFLGTMQLKSASPVSIQTTEATAAAEAEVALREW